MINALLAQREAECCPIRVGIIGAGKFGGALAVRISKMKGMVVSVIVDLNLETARKTCTNCGVPAGVQASVPVLPTRRSRQASTWLWSTLRPT